MCIRDSPQGIEVDCVRSPQALLEELGHREYDVLLIDLNYTCLLYTSRCV